MERWWIKVYLQSRIYGIVTNKYRGYVRCKRSMTERERHVEWEVTSTWRCWSSGMIWNGNFGSVRGVEGSGLHATQLKTESRKNEYRETGHKIKTQVLIFQEGGELSWEWRQEEFHGNVVCRIDWYTAIKNSLEIIKWHEQMLTILSEKQVTKSNMLSITHGFSNIYVYVYVSLCMCLKINGGFPWMMEYNLNFIPSAVFQKCFTVYLYSSLKFKK